MSLLVVLFAAQLSLAPTGTSVLAASPPAQAPQSAMPLAMAVSHARTASPRRRATALLAEGLLDASRKAGRLPNPIFELRTENWSASDAAAAPPLDVFAVATQPIELGGKRDIRRQLAFADSEVARGSLLSLERELAIDTVRAYVRALKARALVETLAENLDGLSAIVATVGRRVAEGYTAEADLLKFKTEAARVDVDIARARLELDRSVAELSFTIGAASPIDATQLVEPAPLDPPVLAAEAITAAVARHPAVLAAGAGVERARQLAAFERARRLPEPLISAGYKRTAGFDTAVLGVSVVIPVFDQNDAAVARTLAEEHGTTASRDALVLQLTSEATALIRAAQAITARARTAPSDLLSPAEEVRRAARAAFREGAADVLKLIDAERVYADVRRAAIELRLDALQATIEARFAVGEETIP